MEPHDDPNCQCHAIEEAIRKELPGCDWNCDAACDAWRERSAKLRDNSIAFAPFSDECYGCTCPTCGRMVCGWCV